MSYLKYDHFTLENCHEVPGFFSHRNSDLDRLASIFLIQGHRLKCRSCHFVLRRMTPLKRQEFISPTAQLLNKMAAVTALIHSFS